jgi:nitrate reductase delta subunit
MPTVIEGKARAMAELAAVFEYPSTNYKRDVEQWLSTHGEEFPGAAFALTEFSQAIADRSFTDLEEIYTRTFDMAPMCSPYISGHIYGDENFERGTLLTALNDRYNQCQFNTGGELPDHLALILKFMPNFSAEELEELSEYCLDKPLTEMYSALSDNPYRHAVKAVKEILGTTLDGARQ